MKKRNKKNSRIDTDLGKELAYIVILPIALKASVKKRNGLYLNNFTETYEKLRSLKNFLRPLIIGDISETSPQYRKRLAYKILCEKLILNIVSGNKKDILSNIEQIMKSENIRFTENNHTALSKEEKIAIRIDFDGTIPSPPQEELKELNEKYPCDNPPPKEERPYPPECYNLNNLPSWKAYKQFSEFRKLEYKLRDAFSEQNIPPEKISSLSINETNFLLKRYMKKRKICYNSSKSKFIKFFITHHEQDFHNYMHTNQKIITEALKAKNMPLPQTAADYEKFIDLSVANMKDKGFVPPLFSIHHKIPVKDGENFDGLSNVNSPANLCLVLDCPYHTMMHLFDTNSQGDAIFNRKVKRVGLPEGMIFFGGMTEKSQFYHNFGKAAQKNITKIIQNFYSGKEK